MAKKSTVHTVSIESVPQPTTSRNSDWKAYLSAVESFMKSAAQDIEESKHTSNTASWETISTVCEAYVCGFIIRYAITANNSRRITWYVLDGRVKTNAFHVMGGLATDAMNLLEPSNPRVMSKYFSIRDESQFINNVSLANYKSERATQPTQPTQTAQPTIPGFLIEWQTATGNRDVFFQSRKYADQTLDRLSNAGYSATIKPVDVCNVSGVLCDHCKHCAAQQQPTQPEPLASVEPIPDYLGAYCKLTRIAVQTDRSEMTPAVHKAFMTYLDRAQQIIRLEAEQAGYPDFETLRAIGSAKQNLK